MKHTYILSPVVLFMLLFTACQQNEPMAFSDSGRIYFYEETIGATNLTVRTSEKNFSFAILDDAVTEAEATVGVRVMGRISDRNRIFRASVVADSSTAVAGTHFVLHEGTVKAGELASELPITLRRTPDMKTAAVKLYLQIEPTDDFGDGFDVGNTFILWVGDMLMQPATWNVYINQYFGAYSDNKYKFIIDVLGITEFPFTRGNQAPIEGTYTAPQMQGFMFELRAAYEEYRKTNPPIWMDDNAATKVEISFP